MDQSIQDQILKNALEILKVEAIALAEAEKPSNRAISALKRLTGFDHGKDIKKWDAALAVNKPLLPVQDEILPVNPGRFESKIADVMTYRRVKFNNGNPERSSEVFATMGVSWASDLPIVYFGGYLVEDAITDAGESCAVDWKNTISPGAPIHPWFKKSRKKDPAKREGFKQTILVGKPKRPFDGITRVKGYMIMKYASEINSAEVRPKETLGKVLDSPELRDLKIKILRIDGNVITLQHTDKADRYSKIEEVQVLDSDGSAMPWTSNSKAGEKDALTFEVIVERPFPNDGKIVFLVYSKILDERIPFLVQNIQLEEGEAVKPPRPPDF